MPELRGRRNNFVLLEGLKGTFLNLMVTTGKVVSLVGKIGRALFQLVLVSNDQARASSTRWLASNGRII